MPAESFLAPQDIRSVAVIGTGAVGANWAALFLARGMRVVAHDPAPRGEEHARALIEAAWPSLQDLGIASAKAAPLDKLRFVDTPAEAAKAADLVQENIPEKPDVKAAVLAQLDEAATPDKIILSSTGGIPPTQLQASCRHPERLVVVHPFNPSHLIPLVEVVGGAQTDKRVIEWAMDFARYLGKQPIRVNVEATGHMTNRLQFALVREAVACLVDGIASARDIDAAVRYGLGPRWTLMGSLLTLHLAGGAGGMKGILDHAGNAIEEWWTPRTTPQLSAEVKERLVSAAQEVSQGESVQAWEAWRDRNLVEVIRLQQASEAGVPGKQKEGQRR
jgi:carnitine 3-dehydrogenase